MIKIKNLRCDEGRWMWRVEDDGNEIEACYYTNKSGEGIFRQHDNTSRTEQITGTCQFAACETVSGTRRKLMRFFNKEYD